MGNDRMETIKTRFNEALKEQIELEKERNKPHLFQIKDLLSRTKEKLKYIAELTGIGLLMWAIVSAGLMELLGRTGGTLILGAVIVFGVFIVIYFYKVKRNH